MSQEISVPAKKPWPVGHEMSMVVSKNPPVLLRHVRSLHRSNIEIDIRKGLPRIRDVDSRCNDVDYRNIIWIWKERLNDVKLNDLRFSTYHKPMRAKKD
jgi:hypothetical protein